MDIVRRLVVIVLFDGVDLLDVTGPEVFSLARRETDDAAGYEVVLAAETLEPVTTGAGVRVLPDLTFEEAAGRSIDTLIVPGRWRSTVSGGCTPSSTPNWWSG